MGIDKRVKKEGFTRKQVENILDINFNTIAKYANMKLVVPEIENSQGTGNFRRYSVINLVEFALIYELSKSGIPLESIKMVIMKIKAFDFVEELKNEKNKGNKIDSKINFGNMLNFMTQTRNWSTSWMNTEHLKRNRLFLKIYDHRTKEFLLSFESVDIETFESVDIEKKTLDLKMLGNASSVLIIDVTALFEKICKATK